MGYCQRRLCIHNYVLRCDTTGPEDWNLTFPDRNHIAKVRVIQVCNADLFRISNVDRCAVYTGHGTGHENGLGYLIIRNWPHTDYHVSVEDASWFAGNVGFIHGNIAFFFNMAYRNTCLNQFRFKRKTTADQEADKILPPEIGNLQIFTGQFSVSVNAVAGKLFGNVGTGSNAVQITAAGVAYLQKRTGAGITLGKE